MEEKKYKIDELNLKLNSFIALLSSRRSGKSYMINNLVYYYLKNHKDLLIYLFSNTAINDEEHIYKYIDTQAIFPGDEATIDLIVNNLINIQQRLKDKKKKLLIIFDDIDLGTSIEAINKLAVMGRHYGITTILSAQITSHAISTQIKNNISYLFFRRLNSKTIKEQIYSLVSTFEHPRELYNYTKDNIKDFQFIFYNNDNDDNNLKIVKADYKNFEYKLPKPKIKKLEYKRKPWDYAPINFNIDNQYKF